MPIDNNTSNDSYTKVDVDDEPSSKTPSPESVENESDNNNKMKASESSTRRSVHIPKSAVVDCLKDNMLCVLTCVGVAAGTAMGVSLRTFRKWTKREIMYMNFPGELFLNTLKCLILPLISTSLVSAVGRLDIKVSGKLGFRAITYYLCTTLLAIILGIALVTIIRPGVGATFEGSDVDDTEKEPEKEALPVDFMLDLIRQLVPPNIIEAAMIQYHTVIKPPENSTETDKTLWNFKLEHTESSNILGIVVFSLVLGITLASMGEKGDVLIDLINTVFLAIMIITMKIIWLSPFGICFLVASKIMEIHDPAQLLGQISLYLATVMAGIFIHGFGVLPLIYFLCTRKNPFSYIANMSKALATSFATSSSSATLPVTIKCLVDNNRIDPRVCNFVLPIGATVNMDGTALYEAVAAIFIAQMRDVPLNFGQIIAISITSTAAAVGAAGIPQAGLVTMVMVLNVVGLPADDIGVLLIVDWILDRFRTLINVLGDAFGAGIVAHLSKDDLQKLTMESEQTI